LSENYPLPFEISSIWSDIELIGILNNFTDASSSYLTTTSYSSKDIALYMSSSAYYKCVETTSCTENYRTLKALDADLNNVIKKRK